MKTIFTAFLLCIFHFNCPAQWEELDVGSTTASYFTDVYAITPDVVIVVGNNGTILKTTDGGATWQQKASGTTENLRKVQFPTPYIGFVVAAGNSFLKTIDGGETWLPINTETDCYFYNFSCVNENLIFITCNGKLMKSEDGGETWNNIGLLSGGEIQFLNNINGYAGEVFLGLSKTEDGGQTWQTIMDNYYQFQFLDNNIGFYYGYGLYKTTNAGNSFSNLTQSSWTFRDIYAFDENNVWGILDPRLDGDGSSRGINKISSSDGEVYTETMVLENNSQIDMLSIHFANEITGYIVGAKNGKATVWKNGTGINTPGTLGTLDEDLVLFKVYPNPTSDKVNISFDNRFSKEFTITLSDMSGKIVYNKIFKNKSELTIDIVNYPKGTYILKINNLKQNYAQKLIVH